MQLKEPRVEVNPASQSIHVADPRAELAYLPAAHKLQDDRSASPLVLVPVGQLSHAVLPKGANVPAEQLVQTPFDEGIVPAEHIQTLDPSGDIIPAGHSKHSMEPAKLEYLPAGQGVYVDAPTRVSSPEGLMGWG